MSTRLVHLREGSRAPNFTLKTTPDQEISLDDFLGQPVVLLFYPADFSPVCASELALYNEILPEFQKHHAQLLGISVDNVWSHLAFTKDVNLHFPLLSDFNPKGDAARHYHAYVETEGEAARALYVIDQGGMIVWGYIAPTGINPGADGVLGALESLHRENLLAA
jgi:peroxiredoxin